MHVCVFCGNELKEGRGMMFVKSNGDVMYFCSHKCYANYFMRNPVKVKWTRKYREEQKVRLKTLEHQKSK